MSYIDSENAYVLTAVQQGRRRGGLPSFDGQSLLLDWRPFQPNHIEKADGRISRLEEVQKAHQNVNNSFYMQEMRTILVMERGIAQRVRLLSLFDQFLSEAEEAFKILTAEFGPGSELKPGSEHQGKTRTELQWKTVRLIRVEDVELEKGWYLYGGTQPSRYWAGKAASNQVKASIALVRFCLEKKIDLTVPLEALFDFHGMRYLATSQLPVEDASLVYGSDNCGQTVHAEDDAFNKLAASLASHFHLIEHPSVGECPHKIHLCGDVQGYRSADGHYYLQELARFWPPEANPAPPSSGVFFRRMRPEFLAYLKSTNHPPLSADALSRWSPPGPESADQDEDVRAATRLLLTERIRAFVNYTQNQMESDVPNLEDLVYGIPTEAARLFVAALVPIQSSIITPAQFIPALNFLFAEWKSSNPDVNLEGYGNWTPLTLFDHPLWVRSYQQLDIQAQLGARLHSFGISIRHLGAVFTHTTSKTLRQHIKVEILRRSAKCRMRWLLTHDKQAAFTFLAQLEQGSVNFDTARALEAIVKEKFDCPTNILNCLASDTPGCYHSVRTVCGIHFRGSSATEGGSHESGHSTLLNMNDPNLNEIQVRAKPNNFMAVIRALHHVDIAVEYLKKSSQQLQQELRNSTAKAVEVRSELSQALTLCKQVTLSDSSDPVAARLSNRLRVLVSLADLRGTPLEHIDLAASEKATILVQWFMLIEEGKVRAMGGEAEEAEANFSLGVAMIGKMRLCLALAGAVGASHDTLARFKDWKCEQEGWLALSEATRAGAVGLFHALQELQVSAGECPSDRGVAPTDIGVIVVRRQTGNDHESDWADGGPGCIGQIMALHLTPSQEDEPCFIVYWPYTTQTQVCLKSKLQRVDDGYLEALCSAGGKPTEALKQLVVTQQKWNLRRVVADRLNRYLKSPEFHTLQDVRTALRGAWTVLCRHRDMTSLVMIRPYVTFSYELLRIAIREDFEEGVVTLLRLTDDPHTSLDNNPTVENSVLLYAASLGLASQVKILLRTRPINGSRKLQALHSSVALGAPLLKTLLQAGVDVNLCDDDNSTTLHIAASKGDSACVAVLLEAKAFVNPVNLSNRTPLALCNGKYPDVEQLLTASNGVPEVKSRLPLIRRFETLGIKCTKVTDLISKQFNVLIMTTASVLEPGFASAPENSQFAHHVKPIRLATLNGMKELVTKCDRAAFGPRLSDAASYLLETSSLTQDAALAIRLLWGNEHVQEVYYSSQNQQVTLAKLFWTRVERIVRDDYVPTVDEANRILQMEGIVVAGASVVPGVNLFDLSALSPEKQDSLITSRGQANLARVAIVICTVNDLRDERRAFLDNVLRRFKKLQNFIPRGERGHIRHCFWVVGSILSHTALRSALQNIFSPEDLDMVKAHVSNTIGRDSFISLLKDAVGTDQIVKTWTESSKTESSKT